MFNLLIERGMDNFTVIELRNALMECDVVFTDQEGARKYVYRQLLAFEKKGWLSVNGARREKRYMLTELFRSQSFKPRNASESGSLVMINRNFTKELEILAQEKKQYEGELAITLGEIEEYQSLLVRFPNNKLTLMPLFDEAKERSAKLLGKINALSKWICATKGEIKTC